MKNLLIIILLLFSMPTNSQDYNSVYFNNIYNLNLLSGCLSIIENNNSFYGCGVSIDSSTFLKTIAIIKLQQNGTLVYWKEFRRNYSDHYVGHGSSFHYIGNEQFVDGGSADPKGLLSKIQETGDTIWTKLFSSKLGSKMIIDHCRILPDKGFICTGQDDYVDAYSDVVLLRTDSLGNELWRKFYGWDTSDKGFKVLPTFNNGFIISGHSYMPGDGYNGDALLIKTDSLGNLEWLRKPGHLDFRDGYGSVTIAPDGNFVFGYTHAVSQGPPYPVPEPYRKIKFMKFGQNGDTLWERMYGNAYQSNMLRNIITLHDGSFVAVGYANSDTITGPMQGWLFKINQYGDSIWYRDYRHYEESGIWDCLYDVFETSDQGLIACGEARLMNGGPDDVQRMWVIKLDSAGCTEPGCDPTIGIEEQGGMEAWGHGGMEIFPNPAQGIVDGRWSMVDFRGDCTLVIYDMFGREMMKITVPENEREIQFDAGNYIPGLYLVVLKDESNIIGSSKLVISR